MLTELRLHNFKTFLNTTLRFQARHLLIGKNCSGKSNLGLSLRFLSACVQKSFSDAISLVPGGMWELCNYAIAERDRVVAIGCSTEVQREGEVYRFRYDLSILVPDPRRAGGAAVMPIVKNELLTVSGGGFNETPLVTSDGKSVRLLHEPKFKKNASDSYVATGAPGDSTMLAKLYELPTNKLAILFRRTVSHTWYFNLSATDIRRGWTEARDTQGLWVTGSNLVLMVSQLKSRRESYYRRMLEHVKRIEPRLMAINHIAGSDQVVVPIVELRDHGEAGWATLSDGTLRAIAFAYIVESAKCIVEEAGGDSPVVIIEEPENSMFVGELRELLATCEDAIPGVQMIFTTHSPMLIDLFDGDLEAVTLLRRDEWRTIMSSLADRRVEIEARLKEQSLGEQFFWELLQ